MKAQSTYPSKQIIQSDTVICSTIEQQKKYLIWKLERDECKAIQSLKDTIISGLNESVAKYETLIKTYDKQESQYKSLVKKQDEIFSTLQAKSDAFEKAYNKSQRQSKRQKIGFITGGFSIAIGLTILMILK